MSVSWMLSSFDQLSPEILYRIMAARQQVFVVEQNVAYLDADGYDRQSWHLTGWSGEDGNVLLAYLRVVPPGLKYPEPSIGRVLTTSQGRRSGYGRELMREGVLHCEKLFPGAGIRISAQQYLEPFYSEFGFRTVSEPYIEDAIIHVEMLKKSIANQP